MNNDEKTTFNTIPHYVAVDYRSGKLKLNELILLLWLRAIGNPYGITTTSLDALRDDIFQKLKKNSVNSILLKLYQKRYVFYKRRQGQKGSFDIHLDDWMMPEKRYKKLDKFFLADKQENGGEHKSADSESYPQVEPSEVSQRLEGQNQKLEEMKSGLISKTSVDSQPRPIRSCHNEHDTEHQIENHDNVVKKTFKGTLVKDFETNNYEEEKCKEIAAEVGEEYINTLRNVLQKNGFWAIEKAWGLYREDLQNGKVIDKPAAYFYGIIKKLLNEQ